MAAPLRSEIDDEYKWAVNDIYSSDEAWNADYEKIMNMAKEPCKYAGSIAESYEKLYQVLKEISDTDYIVERVYVYAFMKYYEDTTNSVYQEMSGKAQVAAVKMSEKYAFAEPEILRMDADVLADYMKHSELKLYQHMIDDMLSQKEHTLSEKEELLLAKASQVMSVPDEVFSKYNNADVRFGYITDEEGKSVELTNGTYIKYMQSQNREVRKAAFECLYEQYKQHINTLAACFYGNVKQAIFKADARHYESTLAMYLSGSFIPVNVYKNLISTVDDNLNLMHRYVDIRKKALGVDELHFYDVYAPMVEDYEWKVTYDEAKDMVLKALEPMGEEYVAKVKEGFDTGWVDVYENKGKRTGAFSWGAYGTHPYVFLNFSGTLDDVFTIIHEMGHAMHTYYSNTNQPYIYAGYKIFVAEVASTCNEALLMNYLLENCKKDMVDNDSSTVDNSSDNSADVDKCADNADVSENEKKRRYLLNHYFEQFKGTLFRQTMFAEFEMKSHSMAEQGEVLTADNLCEVYRELNKKYFGEHCVIDDEIAYEWSRIPHFYTPFYVYQYATGYSAAIAIAAGILKGDKAVKEGYKKFLSGGCSLHPIELLKLCGIDMEKPEVVQSALDVFKGLLDEWESTVK